MSPWLYGAAGAALIGALGGWTVRDWKADSDQLAATNAANDRYEARVNDLAAQSFRFEQLAQSIRASERTDQTTIREIYRDVEVPSDCAAPADVVSLLGDSVRQANAATAGESLDPVPETAPPSDTVD